MFSSSSSSYAINQSNTIAQSPDLLLAFLCPHCRQRNRLQIERVNCQTHSTTVEEIFQLSFGGNINCNYSKLIVLRLSREIIQTHFFSNNELIFVFVVLGENDRYLLFCDRFLLCHLYKTEQL